MIYAARSEQGLRERNEDSILLPKPDGLPLIAVADGMGGHNAGQVASYMAIEAVTKALTAMPETAKKAEIALREAADAANSAVYTHARENPACAGMGTTLALALLHRDGFVALNVGDSRIYHFGGGRLTQISQDHSYVAQLVAMGQITRAQARKHPRRNIITRALGTQPYEQADVFHCVWDKGDMLLLCSDGLYDTLADEQITRMLNDGDGPEDICETLVEQALAHGSTDNISVVLAMNTEAVQ